MIEKPTTEETKMNDEDERDENGKPTQAAVEAMANNVSSAHAGWTEARASGDADKIASWADKVRGEVGWLFTTLAKALGDL